MLKQSAVCSRIQFQIFEKIPSPLPQTIEMSINSTRANFKEEVKVHQMKEDMDVNQQISLPSNARGERPLVIMSSSLIFMFFKVIRILSVFTKQFTCTNSWDVITIEICKLSYVACESCQLQLKLYINSFCMLAQLCYNPFNIIFPSLLLKKSLSRKRMSIETTEKCRL